MVAIPTVRDMAHTLASYGSHQANVFYALSHRQLHPVTRCTAAQHPDPVPLLQLHYRAFVAPTDRSAPVPCFGTLGLTAFPRLAFSLGITATGSRSSA